jgi:hypothetical protein
MNGTGIAKRAAIPAAILLVLLSVGAALHMQYSFGQVSTKDKVHADTNVNASANIGANTNTNSNADVNANASASATAGQSQGQSQGQSHTSYHSSYSQTTADSKDSLTVQTDHHLYKPGEKVTVNGDVSSQLLASLQGTSLILVQVQDNNGNVVNNGTTQLDSNGGYTASFTLPSDAKQGDYTVQAKLEVKADLLGALSADVKAQLQSSTKFVVVSPNAFAVKAHSDSGAEQDFDLQIASNSTVSNVNFDQSKKQISFQVTGQSGTHGVTQITIPKAMLSGDISVAIDGNAVADNDIIVTSDNDTATTLEINYHHSTHTVTITGTTVAPEFPWPVLMMAGALGAMIVAAARAGKLGNRGI